MGRPAGCYRKPAYAKCCTNRHGHGVLDREASTHIESAASDSFPTLARISAVFANFHVPVKVMTRSQCHDRDDCRWR